MKSSSLVTWLFAIRRVVDRCLEWVGGWESARSAYALWHIMLGVPNTIYCRQNATRRRLPGSIRRLWQSRVDSGTEAEELAQRPCGSHESWLGDAATGPQVSETTALPSTSRGGPNPDGTG